ncbi:MAG: histidine phosphatase family protein [Maritimibacter sp.]|nr:histidine phosphatase family protein [Maritimibacter sp.]
MDRRIRYLTHPQVEIDPARDVRDWSLNDVGRARVERLARSGALAGTRTVISSAETKARETAGPLAAALDCDVILRPDMHENDRSATGFLPPPEFERTADRFFAAPDESVRGWETARDAQARILREVLTCLAAHPEGDILFVGHGAVGTLLFCHLAGVAISRAYDQPAGGGAWFEAGDSQFERRGARISGWRPMESLLA